MSKYEVRYVGSGVARYMYLGARVQIFILGPL